MKLNFFMNIPFNVPYTSQESGKNIDFLVNNPDVLTNRIFTKKCKTYFEALYPGYEAFMTTSCTSAMELIAHSIDISPGDEVIMPSYNFVGVANAFANYGAVLKFADIQQETMNIDPDCVEQLITAKTKAIVVMHYGGVACYLDKFRLICDQHQLLLIEDNAQGIGAKYKNERLLGSVGDFSCISFDTMKNISCSEGGVLLCKKKYAHQVTTCYDNGTNKFDFLQEKVKSYEWVNIGSKFILSEYNAAVLYPLLLESDEITEVRMTKWNLYNKLFSEHPELHCMLYKDIEKYEHNAHLFYIKCSNNNERDALLNYLNKQGIQASFHYTPLHSSQRGKILKFTLDSDRFTSLESNRLLRLPIYNSLSEDQIYYVFQKVASFYNK